MSIKVVIFDCDGVLFDSRQANQAYYGAVAQAMGRGPLSAEEIEYVHVHTAFEAVAHILRDRPELIEPAHQFRQKMGYGDFFGLMIPEPGIYDCLEELKPLCDLAVLTNRSDTIGRVLEFHRMAGYFKQVVSCLDVAQPKPDPEGVFKILSATGVRPEEAVYVGDAPSDALTAARAGIHFIAYKNRDIGAPVQIERFDQLKGALEGL